MRSSLYGRIGEGLIRVRTNICSYPGLIDDLGLSASAQSSKEITLSRKNEFTQDEDSFQEKCNRLYTSSWNYFISMVVIPILQTERASPYFTDGQDKATCLKTHPQHPAMTITHPSSGEIKAINRKDPGGAHRSLGWMMTTNGKSNTQFKVINPSYVA
jgi:hypothetical protein